MNPAPLRALAAALIALVIVLLVFTAIQLALFAAIGSFTVAYFQTEDPSWDGGPFGGIQLLLVFGALLPFSIGLTVLAWRRLHPRLARRHALFEEGRKAIQTAFLLLAVALLGFSIPIVKGLVDAYLARQTYLG